MSAFSRAFGVLGVTLVASAAAVFGADALRDAGYLPAAATPSQAEVAAPSQPRAPSPYDRFLQLPFGGNDAAAANAACGFSETLSPGGTYIAYGGAEGSGMSISMADQGESSVLKRFTASGYDVLAYAQDGELVIQAGAENATFFYARTYVLNADGDVTYTEPMLERARIFLGCEDAQLAADFLNAEIQASRPAPDPIRSGLHAFLVGDGYADWVNPSVEGLVQACTPQTGIDTLAMGQTALLGAEFDAEARYGDDIYHEMSGESRSGTLEPMVYLTLMTPGSDYGSIRYLRAPLSWRALLAGEGVVSLVYYFEALEVVGFSVFNDGSRSHSESAGGVLSTQFPCADPESAVAILQQLKDDHW